MPPNATGTVGGTDQTCPLQLLGRPGHQAKWLPVAQARPHPAPGLVGVDPGSGHWPAFLPDRTLIAVSELSRVSWVRPPRLGGPD